MTDIDPLFEIDISKWTHQIRARRINRWQERARRQMPASNGRHKLGRVLAKEIEWQVDI